MTTQVGSCCCFLSSCSRPQLDQVQVRLPQKIYGERFMVKEERQLLLARRPWTPEGRDRLLPIVFLCFSCVKWNEPFYALGTLPGRKNRRHRPIHQGHPYTYEEHNMILGGGGWGNVQFMSHPP
ncbi:hypothetical protein AVEN_106609-1 [Araneus ventricosus]|uniref:Uncharacterized protein n=1 Tax=Araneus ventricosus TaxID=182803 RepID=A0A4Y2NJH9_ARAVE|nr:hypothetical protein AVEN_106609-1 [Araneus ventricosus]